MRREDWLLAQLPIGMVEDDFFVRFASIFQEVATSMLDNADNVDHIIDVSVAPESMVRWLGSWIGADTIDPGLPGLLQRLAVRTAASTLAWRGTQRGLTQFVELLCGDDQVTVTESGGVYPEGGAPDVASRVRIDVASTGGLPDADFVTLVRDQVPATAFAEIFIADRRIWPPESSVSMSHQPRVPEVSQ